MVKKYKQAKAKLLMGIAALLILLSCSDFKKNKAHEKIPDYNIARGRELAAIYCQSCHQLPDPSFLNTKSWEEGVLPNMGPYLGIFTFDFKQYPNSKSDRFLSKDYYPSHPLISLQQWQYIIDYYTSMSPDSLPAQTRIKPIRQELSDFEVLNPEGKFPDPAVTFIRFDTLSRKPGVLLYDIVRQSLIRFDTHLKLVDSVRINSPIVAADIGHDSLLLCNVGVINPNNGHFGKLQWVKNTSGKMQLDSIPLLDSLARPVGVQALDLNGDGKTDYLMNEFGNLKGELAWFENAGGGQFKKHILRNMPGAITTIINDYNHDGLPDIWTLFAQADEGLFLFTNKGKGQFEEKKILAFPPMQGSTSFELQDFNHDGFPDILYTCGDNADFSPVLKPYHGIYIFLNDGHNQFANKYFFPMHGCFKAMARDFDKDGDLDIAAISFFADYVHQPEEGFVYLKNTGTNTGSLDFEPYSFPANKSGRWLTMDAADLDGDGKTDIILGNFSVHMVSKMSSSEEWKNGPLFLVLRNLGKK